MLKASFLLDKMNAHISGLRFERTPKGLYAPVEYVLSLGGKRIRPVLMMMAYNLYKDDVDSILNPATAIEVYHNYTLLHDDLMDRADVRRGKATVHKVWDDNTAILSGDAMLVLAYRFLSDCPPEHMKALMDVFSFTALEICEGQQFDMEFEKRIDVAEQEYIEMIRLKTAVLLAASLKIGAILGGASQKDADLLYNVGMQIGVAFQLQDDFLDVYGDPAVFGKKIGGDILCNKKTYMLINALNTAKGEQLDELNRWIGEECNDPEAKIKAVTELYNQLGIREMCEAKMNEYYNCAMESLSGVDVSEDRKSELKAIMNKLICRDM